MRPRCRRCWPQPPSLPSPPLDQALLGVPSLEGGDPAALYQAFAGGLPNLGTDLSARVHAIVAQLQSAAPQAQRVRVVLRGCGDPAEVRFHWHLIQDRQNFVGGNVPYGEYLAHVARESLAPPAVAAPAAGK